ncbi:DNA (cytosine-5-)-methyltransferase [Clostridium gasigenes]|uniref:DNA (cytosine-5-)-methyltransferase n=1 Tax=Clostridium gasigenes TaxID=94869 RepID=UPI00209B2EC2|nr:DNA (cytosine-5-)-methyltransferase [Clostridium gasigenes]
MKYLSLFSGIGSPEQALKNRGIDFELFGFSEIDKYAIKSYCAVHGVDESLNLGDITKIDIEKLPLDIDLITHGSPCQDFSLGGKGNGGDLGSGTRSSLMWNTVAICDHCKPKYVIWENVKNVLSKKHIHNFDKYLEEMDRIGYKNYYKILNAKDFGVPQNRQRIFVISIRKDIKKDFEFPIGINNNMQLKDILENKVDPKYYINTERVNQLILNIENKIDLSKQVIGTCYKKNDLSKNTRDIVYNESKISPCLTATMYKDAPKILRVGNINPRGKGMNRNVFDEDGLIPTITTNKGEGIKKMSSRLGGLFDDEKGKHQAGSVWDTEGLSPTLDTMQGGHRQPCIISKVLK